MINKEPWQQRKEWANNSIRSKSKTGIWMIWIFAIVWNLISLPILFDDSLYRQLSQKPETAFVFLFPLIGAGLLFAAIYSFLRWRKFGPTPLVLDPFPASLGGHLAGSIETNIPFNEENHFSVTADCLKSYVSGTGKNRSRKERPIWQSEGIAFTEASPQGTKVSFRFAPPQSLPESGDKSTETYHLWRISLECELEGIDFSRRFEVPVFNGIRHSQSIDNDTESFHKTVEHAHQEIYEIAQIEPIDGGLSAYFPAFKRPAGGIFASIFGSVFFGIGIFLGTSTDAALILPISFTITGALIAIFGFWDLGKSLKVKIKQNGVSSRRFFLGYPMTTRSASLDQIKNIKVKEGASMNSGNKTTIYYSIIANTQQGKSIVLAERLTSKPEVNLLKDTIESYIGK